MVTIKPLLRIIDIGNGCEAFSSTLYIPAKSELTTTMQSLTRSQFFLNYNLQYVQTLEPMDMKIFNEKFKLINKDYPLTLPPWLILSG